MKKIFVLLILSMLSTNLFAQTQKLHVFGFTFGETSPGEISKCLKKEGWHYSIQKSRGEGYVDPLHIFEVNNVPLAGVTWDLARFKCYPGYTKEYYRLEKVEFIKVIPAASRKIVSSKISEISEEIKEKYGNSIKLADHSPWDSSKNNDDIIWKTYDGSNWILIKYFYTGKGDDYSISLTFIYEPSYCRDYKEDIEIEVSSKNDSGVGLDDSSPSAQTGMKILGFTLGKTTKEEVMNYYGGKGVHYKEKMGYINWYIEVEHLTFNDEKWDFVCFYFYDGKLTKIEFSNVIQTREMVITKLEETNKAVRKRYGNGIEEKNQLPWEMAKLSEETVWATKDGSIWIETKYSYTGKGDDYTLKKTFYDKELSIEYEKDKEFEKYYDDTYGF